MIKSRTAGQPSVNGPKESLVLHGRVILLVGCECTHLWLKIDKSVHLFKGSGLLNNYGALTKAVSPFVPARTYSCFVAIKKCRILVQFRFCLLACLLPKPRLFDANDMGWRSYYLLVFP